VLVCASVAFAVGASVLVGWAFDIQIVTTRLPGYVNFKANTAVCLVAGSAALLARSRSARDRRASRLAAICATVVLVVAGLTLAEYVLGWCLGIDPLLVRETVRGPGTSHPGRMAPNTTLSFLFVAAALHAARSRSGRARRIAQACAFSALFLTLVALVGYLYGAHILVGLFSQTRMAVHTIVGMLALCAGILWLTAKGGWLSELTARGSGRTVAKSLLPAAFLIPVTVGMLTLGGYRAGLYDPAFGTALMAVGETVSFATLVWLCARSLNASERGRTLAGQDELTGLLNRRGFLRQGEERRGAARRLGEEALLVFIDLDGMKVINDTLGHAAGDRALVETARVLRATFRDDDVVARLGGDEFAIFAGSATVESAPSVLGRLEAHLRRLNAKPARDFTLRLSAGVTACRAIESDSIVDLLERADAQMYEQKKAKRRLASHRASLGPPRRDGTEVAVVS
jgi:diguanylate cyclase (GGDEF)-like protein